MNRYLQGNQQLWEEWADINYRSKHYDVAGFKAGPAPLDEMVLEGVGDVAGKSLLHLQCHFGKDTLRLAMLGAKVTGIDFSSKAIAFARGLASEMEIPAEFIETNLYDLPSVLDAQFDVVFTSYGVLSWLPDLQRWSEIIARFLKPGGVFFIAETHPTMTIFDNDDPKELCAKFSYFHGPEPIIFEPKTGNYADADAVVTQTEYCFQHDMAEIVNSLLRVGLRLEYLREYPYAVWKAFPFLVQDERGYWHMPEGYPPIPLTFTLRAIMESTPPRNG